MKVPTQETVVLGGGCFWCLEAVFTEIEGVESVRSGYAGGHDPAPTYRSVCSETTGHAEVVEVVFDPEVIPLEEILRIFFAIHDPTTRNRQGADVGSQYRSIILTSTPSQEAKVQAVLTEVRESGLWNAPPVTEVFSLERFHPAEAEHHRYYARNPGASYCRFVVEPKVLKARSAFAHRIRKRV
jgi:peptide-methionine (S)-S-oxide reductase